VITLDLDKDVELLDIPIALWVIFLFVLGASVGSFLNVVVYRLPRDLSLISPGSHCTSCKRPIRWYDNIPILAWFILGGRCRYCKVRFSFRYPLVELLTGLLFVGLYELYFFSRVRPALPAFAEAGWLIYLGHIVLVSALLASSLIDAEHWIIPLPICYTVVVVGLILSMIWPYWLMNVPANQLWRLVPYAGVKTAALGAGGLLGLLIGMLLIRFKVLKSSFAEHEEAEAKAAQTGSEPPEIEINIRLVMLREIAFLAPAVVLALLFMVVLTGENELGRWWQGVIIQQKWAAGLLGSVFGFIIGGAVVWATRILGSLAFGREAMGLGDVHLIAAVGAMLGWVSPAIAFFVAPFFGLAWALARLLIHRRREIPYGPFLSMATLIVMVIYDPIVDYILQVLQRPIILP